VALCRLARLIFVLAYALICPHTIARQQRVRNGLLPRASPSASLGISRKDSLCAWRILELTLRSKPVLSIETVCVAAIDVDLVGPVSDVFGGYDHERRRMCVINHSDNLCQHTVAGQRVSRAAACFVKALWPSAYPLRRGRDVLNGTLRRSSRGLADGSSSRWRVTRRVRRPPTIGERVTTVPPGRE